MGSRDKPPFCVDAMDSIVVIMIHRLGSHKKTYTWVNLDLYYPVESTYFLIQVT